MRSSAVFGVLMVGVASARCDWRTCANAVLIAGFFHSDTWLNPENSLSAFHVRSSVRSRRPYASISATTAAIVAGVFLASSSVDRPHTLVAHSAASDAAAFAMVFTPTPDEDGAI